MVKLPVEVHKGQNARSGGGVRLGFEGGQTAIIPSFTKTWIYQYQS